MLRAFPSIAALVLLALAAWGNSARADMGPCVPAAFDLVCGNGPGAARAILKTVSPSKRLAFAWRLSNRPPIDRPEQSDPYLENFVVRIEDGAVLARSHGAYWDLGSKIAKAFLVAAWSPDSRLLLKVEQSAESSSAELYSFTGADKAIGPIELIKGLKSAVQEKMQQGKAPNNSNLLFNSHPVITVDDQGLIHATVFTRVQDASDSRPYEVVVQVLRTGDSLDAKVISITPYEGTVGSIIVH
jgi:hypothetical protein